MSGPVPSMKQSSIFGDHTSVFNQVSNQSNRKGASHSMFQGNDMSPHREMDVLVDQGSLALRLQACDAICLFLCDAISLYRHDTRRL